jgi:hypothetical protein
MILMSDKWSGLGVVKGSCVHYSLFDTKKLNMH